MSVPISREASKVPAWVTTPLRLSIEPGLARRASTILAPIAAVVIGIKAYKLLFALWPVTESTLGWHRPGLLEAAKLLLKSPLTILVLGGAGGLLALRVRAPRWRATFAALGSAALLVALYVVTTKLRLDGVAFTELIPRARDRLVADTVWLLSIFRGSIAFLLLYAAFVLLALAVAGRRAWVYRSLQVLNLLLVALAGLELAHYVKTGLNGSGPLLLYALRNTLDVATLASSELDRQLVLALALPFLL